MRIRRRRNRFAPESRSVLALGIVLIAFALLWRFLIGGNPMNSFMGYSMKSSETRKVLVVTTDGEAFVGQVVNHGMEDTADSKSGGSSAYSDNSSGHFSFARDVLGIYQPVDLGKIIRVLMYVSGGGLLLISNVKRR
jgi:hypothetical protein